VKHYKFRCRYNWYKYYCYRLPIFKKKHSYLQAFFHLCFIFLNNIENKEDLKLCILIIERSVGSDHLRHDRDDGRRCELGTNCLSFSLR